MLRSTYILTVVLLILSWGCSKPPKDKFAGSGASAQADSLRIAHLIARGEQFRNSTVDSLPGIAWELESISRFRDNKAGLVYANMFKGYYYWLSASSYPTAMKVTLQALSDAEKWQQHKLIPALWIIMANIHKENGNYPAAFKDCQLGLTEARQNRDTANIISLLGLNAMFTHGYYHKKGHPENDHTSLNLQLEGLKMAESQPKYEQRRISFYNNIAQTYKENKQYDLALSYARKAVSTANKYHQPRSLTYSYNWMGEAYYYMGEREKGVAYLDSAVAIAKTAKLPYREMEIYEAMHWCYMSAKDYDPAIMYLRRSARMRDSLQVAKNEKEISEMQLKYNTGGKDKQIALLAENNKLKSQKILRITVAMILFVILMLVILYQYVTIHRYSRSMSSDNKGLNDSLLKIAYIQSHQIRKPLASILGLMNVIKANNYVADKEVLQNMDAAAQDLDERIREVIGEAEKRE